MDGKRTSVYLTPALAARVTGSGMPLAVLITAGLDHLGAARIAGEAPAVKPPRKPRAKAASPVPAVTLRPPVRRCTHPGKRIVGGFCDKCDHLILSGGQWA